MSAGRPQSSKGRTELDTAMHTIRECWAAHEVLTRCGFSSDNLAIRIGLRPGDMEQDEPVPAAAIVLTAELETPNHQLLLAPPKVSEFEIVVGPTGLRPIAFERRWRLFITAIIEGATSEDTLRRTFVQSQAYETREVIFEALEAKGFQVETRDIPIIL